MKELKEVLYFSDGLMSLLKQIGQAYVHLSAYECKQALNAFSSLAPHHYNTGWVLTQVGRAHFELAEYQQVIILNTVIITIVIIIIIVVVIIIVIIIIIVIFITLFKSRSI